MQAMQKHCLRFSVERFFEKQIGAITKQPYKASVQLLPVCVGLEPR